MTFATAKLLAARRRAPFPSAHLDAIARNQWGWQPQAVREEVTTLDEGTMLKTLQRGEWDTVSIHCHGDGAHGNLNSIVLCGVVDDEEHVVGGHRAGCAPHDDPPRCKRVHDNHRQAFRFGDLRARNICLFTCNGFSIAGDIYPSNASFVLSAIEGYAAAVLTTDRRIRFESWMFTGAHALLGLRWSPGQVLAVLNDVCAFTEECRPYLLCGDPADLTSYTEVEAPEALAAHHRSAVRVQPIGDFASSLAIGLDAGATDMTVERGKTVTLIVSRDGTLGPPHLLDKTSDLESLKSAVNRAGTRARRAIQLVAAVHRHHGNVVRRNATVSEACAELAVVSARLEEAINEGGRLFAEIKRRGVWLSEADTWRLHMLLLSGMWDAQFAALLDEYLLENDLCELLRDGFQVESRSTGQQCVRCGCRVSQALARAPLLGSIEHAWLDCPTCGPGEAWDAGLPRLLADPPQALAPGCVERVSVGWTVPHDPPFDSGGCAFLVTHLKDSGRGVLSYRNISQVDNPPLALTIPVPIESAAEIHTLRFAFVRDLGVSYLRLRAPCLVQVT